MLSGFNNSEEGLKTKFIYSATRRKKINAVNTWIFVNDFAVDNPQKCWIAFDLILLAGHGIGCAVNLWYLDRSVMLKWQRQLVPYRGQQLAVAAPRRVEVDEVSTCTMKIGQCRNRSKEGNYLYLRTDLYCRHWAHACHWLVWEYRAILQTLTRLLPTLLSHRPIDPPIGFANRSPNWRDFVHLRIRLHSCRGIYTT